MNKEQREKAMDWAIRHAESGDTPGNIIKAAKQYYEFVMGDERSPDTRSALEAINNERTRQIAEEGWDAEHDDAHENRELAHAAACYVEHYATRGWMLEDGGLREELKISARQGEVDYANDEIPDGWMWDEHWWKPRNARDDLIRAGALIVAELERLNRKERGQCIDD